MLSKVRRNKAAIRVVKESIDEHYTVVRPIEFDRFFDSKVVAYLCFFLFWGGFSYACREI